jgi:succinate-semialdehyde dehydrogenase/glutarate-semialdehyde dehydrogenase
MGYQSVNPATGKVQKKFKEITSRPLETSLETAAACFNIWRFDRPGSFMEPAILTNIKPGNPAGHEEFFQPVALFFRVNDEDEAVALANDSESGLGGSVFTADGARGKRVAGRIDTGMVFINQPTWTSAELPFGGINNSGDGRELSSLGVHEFVNKKLVRVSSIGAPA